jgi:NhaP-type Na+/H+ or K+/H+ antiporter
MLRYAPRVLARIFLVNPAFNVEAFLTALALVGIVIVVAALLSGVVERTGFPQVGVFLAIGAMLGPVGLGILDVTLDSPILRVVATLSLVLVLFTDAVTLDVARLRQHGLLAFLSLGPGTLITAALVAVAAWVLLGLPPAAAAILGAALASTDPVLLRNLLQRRDIPPEARESLRAESGLNDLVLLPVIILAMTYLRPTASHDSSFLAREAVSLFLLGPAAGVAVGLLGIGALDLVRRQINVRRDYESLYALGLAFTAYAAAEAVHGSGFLAAFAAGLAISALDVELCDCFIEYGQTTAEMTLLFTFVLLGSSLIWSGLGIVGPLTLLFVVVTLLLRPAVYLSVLARVKISRFARLLIAWFGPRGLSSLLLVLLPVFAGVAGSEQLFTICCLVVLASLVLHGVTPMFLGRAWPAKAQAQDAAQAVPIRQTIAFQDAGDAPTYTVWSPPNGTDAEGDDAELITIEKVQQLQRAGEPVVLLDVRTDKTYLQSDRIAAGAVRLEPDHVVDRARELNLPREAWIVPYCT